MRITVVAFVLVGSLGVFILTRPTQAQKKASEIDALLKDHGFDIAGAENMDPEIVRTVEYVVALVWKKNRGSSEHFKLSFEKNSSRWPPDVIAAIDYSDGSIRFNIDKVAAQANILGLSVKQAIIIAAAHEAMHKVQKARGDDYESFLVPEGNFVICRKSFLEDEADTESLHVLKFIHPDAEGYIVGEGIRFEVPQKSKYAV